MIRVLFLIHDLGEGGAEKVLVNLVNHMDRTKFDVSVTALFGGGVNERFLAPHIRYRAVWKRAVRGNSHFMKLFSPEKLHRMCVKEDYDVEVAFLEGPSTRIVSGCPDPKVKRIAWVHICLPDRRTASRSYRSYREAQTCVRSFDQTVCVSRDAAQCYQADFPDNPPPVVLPNANDTEGIRTLARAFVPEKKEGEFRLAAMGKLIPVKGFDRLCRIVKTLSPEFPELKLWILGDGPERRKLEDYVKANGLKDRVDFLGYQENPYPYLARADLFVSASFNEGYSTAVSEALILGTPVCAADCGGMRELLGEHSEYGLVTENTEDALCGGLRSLLQDPGMLAEYRDRAAERGRMFSADEAARKVEELLEAVWNG